MKMNKMQCGLLDVKAGAGGEMAFSGYGAVFGNRDSYGDVIERGAFADIAVWEEDGFRAQATYVAPHRFASGVSLVMVNGRIPYRDGTFTGDRGGRFLERKR